MSTPHDDSTSRQNESTIASETRVVRAWHEALNSGDVDLLVELSHPDVEVGGPRGVGHGAQLLREWVGQAKIRLEPRRVFHREDTVVVEQWAKWRAADTGQVTSGQSVSSVFDVRDDQITTRNALPRPRGRFRCGQPRRVVRDTYDRRTLWLIARTWTRSTT